MNSIRQIERLNELEMDKPLSSSWHMDYKDSAYIYIGNLDYDLNEEDIITVFSEFGEPTDINLVRDKETKKSKGYCFLKYADQRSTILAVDNMTNVKLLDRLVRVDHVASYRVPKKGSEDGAAPSEIGSQNLDALYPPSLPRTELESAERSPAPDEHAEPLDEKDMLDPMHEYIKNEKRRKVDDAHHSSHSSRTRRHRHSDRHRHTHRRHRDKSPREN
ncbi:RNA-binding protein Cwf29 [Schizosaccharomyces cryophilus OY26]|uniref:RNA-binding protein Cwf29 n=1 Tax=Schizosaccharomyces cryophilus (strain OY26 / ATCC MYA-4695 / CBS 11777 / NBRC 106824 / NRRL Y48691) TaxID=653667 RepID=S9VZ82_SCHCR|nr:RNA-binding protein Cwf29 [Schizosaccharomyces cryophilus OY26]EPY51120.1 RNA-binding protein Cwf29 [Schizosaccharomyces cryophilus OY26]